MFRLTEFAQQALFQVTPEGSVPYAVDDWTNGAWQDLNDDVHGKKGIGVVPGEIEPQCMFQQWFCICGHAQKNLKPVQDYCVSGFFSVSTCRLGGEQDLEIGEEDDEPDNDQVDDVSNVPLLDDRRIPEGRFPQTEDPGEEEVHGLQG